MRDSYGKIFALLKKAIVAGGRFFDRHTSLITLCVLSAVAVILFIPVVGDVFDKSIAVSGTVTDWGLSFGESNAPPRGNVSSSELLKYDACFMGDESSNKIWLTFDAGYENGYTAKILDILKEKNVSATFFLVEHYMKTAPELVLRMADEGHTVGNHTASHPDMSKLSGKEALRAELEPVEKLYFDITGKEMIKYYRPPQGKFSIDNLSCAKELGYKTVFWSLAYVDWNVNSQPDPQASIDKLCSRIHGGAVVLLHSTSATNAEILGTLIDRWRDMGYEFGTPEELFEQG